MKSKDLEKRVSDLEAQVSALMRTISAGSNHSKPWWERIAGSFEHDPRYKKAMQLGRKYRKSLKGTKRRPGTR